MLKYVGEGQANVVVVQFLDREFLMLLDFLKREKIAEAQFDKANAGIREKQERLQAEKERLETVTKRQTETEQLATEVRKRVRGYFKQFKDAPIQKQKAALQSIVKSIHVLREGRLEVEFRP